MPKLPGSGTRLPPGTRRADFEPEVLEEFDRRRRRIEKRIHRKRAAHRGIRAMTFPMGQEARDKLDRMSKATGLSKMKLINIIIENADEESIKPVPPQDR